MVHNDVLQLPDGEGRESRLVIWSHPGSDVTGMVARCEKVAGTMEQVSHLFFAQYLHCRLRGRGGGRSCLFSVSLFS